jgi:hypothetical protein
MFTEKSPAFSFFIFSKITPITLSVELSDLKGSLDGLQISANGNEGKIIPVLDAGWICIDYGARRGLNKLSVSPVYSLDDDSFHKRNFHSWSGTIRFRKAILAHPELMLKGLAELTGIEEELYFHLRRFDSLLRVMPHERFPEKFIRDLEILPQKMKKAVSGLQHETFISTMNDFYRYAYGKNISLFNLSQAQVFRMKAAEWIWDEPDKHPLAAHIYYTNSQQIYLQSYFSDVVLAKRAVKTCCTLIEYGGDRVDLKMLESLVSLMKREKDSLSNLVEATDFVNEACNQRIDVIYSTFPQWKKDFPRTFSARVRARFWPAGLYPQKDDLLVEKAILSEYCRVVKSMARESLGQVRLRHEIVSALVSLSPKPVAAPVVHPFNPQDNP